MVCDDERKSILNTRFNLNQIDLFAKCVHCTGHWTVQNMYLSGQVRELCPQSVIGKSTHCFSTRDVRAHTDTNSHTVPSHLVMSGAWDDVTKLECGIIDTLPMIASDDKTWKNKVEQPAIGI